MGGAWGLEDRCQPYHLPPPPAPHLVDHPINLHRNDEVSIVHWLQEEESCWSWGKASQDHPPRPGQGLCDLSQVSQSKSPDF